MKTRITELLGIEHPIIQCPMAWVATPSLVCAATNAGGLGLLATPGLTPEELRQQIHEIRRLTGGKVFGVNILPTRPGFKRHIKVILEEYYRKQDNPGALLYEKVYEIAYASSPLKQTVLGVPDSISAITREQMIDYYHRYYAPRNMLLIAVGDVSTRTLLEKIRSTFDGFDRQFAPYKAPPMPEKRNSGNAETVSKEIKESYLALVFPAPGIREPDDVYAMDVLLYVLGEGRSSRLQQEIKEKKRLVSSIATTYPTHKHKGVFVVSATLKRHNLDAAKRAILAELEKLRTKGVKGNELAKAKKLLSNVYYFSNETAAGQSGSIGFYYTLTDDTSFERNYLANIQKQSARDLQRVAKKYLLPEALNQVIIEPITETPAQKQE